MIERIPQIFETDWLASKPVFYNEKTGQASYNIEEIIDYSNLEFDPEGFNNYLEFGYSVFGQTPIKNIKFLEPSTRFVPEGPGKFRLEKSTDQIDERRKQTTAEEDLLGLIRQKISRWEAKQTGKIILPLSGGYDSRLLAQMTVDKSRLRAFTFGVSPDQTRSCEVVGAREIADRLGIDWNFVPLGNIHAHLQDWDRAFGPAVHAHGMYHFEFYRNLKKMISSGDTAFLSGIFGDLWAGNLEIQNIGSAAELEKLSYNHGLRADRTKSLLKDDGRIRNDFWSKNKTIINDPYHQTILVIRLKMILISYLLRVPEIFGFRSWSPFLDQDIALGMLTLPTNRRQNRVWQKEYFQKTGILPTKVGRCDPRNNLAIQSLKIQSLPELNRKLLGEIVQSSYIEEINLRLAKVQSRLQKDGLYQKIFNLPKIGGFLKKAGLNSPEEFDQTEQEAYNAYLVLKPIEQALIKRNQAKKHGDL